LTPDVTLVKLQENYNKKYMHNIGLVHCNGLESIIEFTSMRLDITKQNS